MQESPRHEPEAVEIRTDDGVVLHGDLVRPVDAVAAAIVCHPHPQYGGNRFDHVVGALFDALPGSQIAALRFDFRSDFGGGVAEAADARAAIERLGELVPGVPIIAGGYSFGAMVALALEPETVPVAAKLLVAPPLTAMEIPAPPDVPTLVITPEHDQFTSPAAAAPIIAEWDEATLEAIPMADHFLHGRTAAVVDVALAWIADLLD